MLTGLGLLSLHQRFIEPRIRRNSRLDRHRLVAVFITGFIAGLPLNAVMQFMWLKVGLFVYTEAAGPVLHLFGKQLPVYMVIYDSVLFAIVALLCVRDDTGRPALLTKIAQSLPRWGNRITTTRLMVIATVVLMSAVLLPIAVFSLLRVARRSQARLRPLALSHRQGLRPIRRLGAGRQAGTVLPVTLSAT